MGKHYRHRDTYRYANTQSYRYIEASLRILNADNLKISLNGDKHKANYAENPNCIILGSSDKADGIDNGNKLKYQRNNHHNF